jgi:hypothetical protein
MWSEGANRHHRAGGPDEQRRPDGRETLSASLALPVVDEPLEPSRWGGDAIAEPLEGGS